MSISVISACPSMYILVIISLKICTSGSFFKYILLKKLWFIKIRMWFSSGIFYAVCEICSLADTSHKTLLRKTCLDFTSKLHQLLKAKLAKLTSAAQKLLVFTHFLETMSRSVIVSYMHSSPLTLKVVKLSLFNIPV